MVDIADDVFAWADDERSCSNESFVVRGSFSHDAGVSALRRAGARFMCVDERGVEHRAADAPPIGDDGVVLYTPNYVSNPEPTPEGLRVYVDCKSQIEPAMRDQFLRILHEELGPLGGDVTVAVAD